MSTKNLINRINWLMIILPMTWLLFAACNNTKHEYPVAVTDTMMSSCETTSKGNRDGCLCVLDKFQRKYTYEEFSVIEVKMQAGQTPPEYLDFLGKARAECTK